MCRRIRWPMSPAPTRVPEPEHLQGLSNSRPRLIDCANSQLLISRLGKIHGTMKCSGRSEIEGFEAALQRRPDRWMAILESGGEACIALSGLIMLSDPAQGESNLSEPDVQGFIEKAPDLVPAWVESLHAWRINQHRPGPSGMPAPTFGKVGRNDPYPCGSGKKYK